MKKKRGKRAKFALGLTLAAVIGVGSVAMLPKPELKLSGPIETFIFDGTKLRKAWIDSTCAIADTTACERTWDRRGYCICLTREQASLPSEIAKGSSSALSKWKVRRCQHKDDPTDIIVRIQNPEDGNPKDYQCKNIANNITSNTSLPSYQSSLDDAMQSECGFTVTGGDWGCCPRCMYFPNGCPPCIGLCQYGNDWPGHESECNPSP